MSWEILAGYVIGVLPILESRREKEKDRVDEALHALGDAYYSTLSYYETDKPRESAKRQEQIRLAQKWDKVANLTRRYDRNLASRFSIKSRFWQEGRAWSDEQIKGANIGLEKVRKDARFLLIPKQGKG